MSYYIIYKGIHIILEIVFIILLDLKHGQMLNQIVQHIVMDGWYQLQMLIRIVLSIILSLLGFKYYIYIYMYIYSTNKSNSHSNKLFIGSSKFSRKSLV